MRPPFISQRPAHILKASMVRRPIPAGFIFLRLSLLPRNQMTVRHSPPGAVRSYSPLDPFCRVRRGKNIYETVRYHCTFCLLAISSWPASNAFKFYQYKPCWGMREFLPDGQRGDYKFITYAEAEQLVLNLGSGLAGRIPPVGRLVAAGLAAELIDSSQRSFVGICSSNRTEWAATDIACSFYSFVSVPLHHRLGAHSCDARSPCCPFAHSGQQT